MTIPTLVFCAPVGEGFEGAKSEQGRGRGVASKAVERPNIGKSANKAWRTFNSDTGMHEAAVNGGGGFRTTRHEPVGQLAWQASAHKFREDKVVPLCVGFVAKGARRALSRVFRFAVGEPAKSPAAS
ncbi:hypothetical protein RA307_22385 [Xanthobacteraceae bacterium Astr-EGSB]|uniref:hypothetical protein n=1 Tax=Astrobacterium formosum TaxID=3069710 RepID=UPI0027AEAF6D|nr:hypothetical protein [Xanthobacteraceae bacterium Astr-EGSB]